MSTSGVARGAAEMNEHGWNDPPVFTYSSLQTGAAKKTQLTKRVQHDLTTHPPQTPHKHPEAITDFPSGPPIISVPSEEPKQTQEISELVTETSTRSTLKKPEDTSAEVVTLESVQQCLERIMADHKHSMPSRTTTEVRSRLTMFADQWKSGKLSEKVQLQMAKLATALEDGNHSLADEIHVALMVDHVSEVSKWMVGVKRLIALLKQQSQTN